MASKLVACLLFAFLMNFAGNVPVRTLDEHPATVAELETSIPKVMKAAGVPCLALAVVNDGKVVFARGFGVRDTTANEPTTADTIFEGCSFSKPVFAYAVMKLVERGTLDLDRPLWKYAPNPDIEHDERCRSVTARMVLSHTTGLVNLRWLNPDKKLDFKSAPGERFGYSGEGFRWLQAVVEKITGQSLDEFIRKSVFEPLGMTRSFMAWTDTVESNHAVGTDESLKPVEKRKPLKASAVGSLHTTVGDYAKFLIAVRNGVGLEKRTSAEMLRPSVLIRSKRMFGPDSLVFTDENKGKKLGWALGFGTFESSVGGAFFHTGHDDGFEHFAVYFKDKNIGAVVMTASSNGESLFEEILRLAIHDRYTPVEWLGFEPYRKLIEP